MEPKKPGRPSKEDQNRKDVLLKLEPLTAKWIAHVKESLEAVLPCSYCSYIWNDIKTVQTLVSSVKKDVNGKCLKCHGTLIVPDISRRDWAAEQLGDRIAPKPKAQEIKIKDDVDMTEFEKGLEGVADDVLAKLSKDLNIVLDNGDK